MREIILADGRIIAYSIKGDNISAREIKHVVITPEMIQKIALDMDKDARVELGPCVRYKNKIYCFDAILGRYAEVVISPIDMSVCPDCVIQDIALIQAGEMPHFCNDNREDI